MDGEDARNLNYLQDVGIIMDDSFLSKDWKISMVNEAMKCGYENWQEDKFFSYIKNFGIEKNKKVKELSRGMKIKLMFSIALSHQANLLILDEPTSGLDLFHMRQVASVVNQVADTGRTALVVTHDPEFILRCCNYVLHLENGQIQESYSIENNDGRNQLLKFFLNDMEKEVSTE